ncbi:MAG: TetR/AcrR family transcriptional regulator [Candidatus Rifleibacteriota bacterium]
MTRKKRKDEQLLDSALEVFVEKGFEKTTIDDIVTRTGCGKGTFYRYYSNKEDLFARLDDKFLKEMGEKLAKNCRPELDPRSYLHASLSTFLETFNENKKIGLIRFERDLRLSAEERAASAKKILKHFFYMKDHLDQAKARGIIRNFNSETVLITLIGAAHFFLFREFKLGISYAEKEIEEVVDIIYYGVKAP